MSPVVTIVSSPDLGTFLEGEIIWNAQELVKLGFLVDSEDLKEALGH